MSSRYMAADKKANHSTDTANQEKGRRIGWAGVLVIVLAGIMAQYQLNLAMAVIGLGTAMLGTALLITKQWGGRVLICIGIAFAIMEIVFAIQG